MAGAALAPAKPVRAVAIVDGGILNGVYSDAQPGGFLYEVVDYDEEEGGRRIKPDIKSAINDFYEGDGAEVAEARMVEKVFSSATGRGGVYEEAKEPVEAPAK